MSVTAAIRRRAVEAAISTSPRVEIFNKSVWQFFHRQPDQLAAQDRRHFLLKHGPAVLLVLLGVGERRLPASDEAAETGNVLAEPDEALNLLPVERAMLLLELLQLPRMVRANELRQHLLIRRLVAEQLVAANPGKRRCQVRPLL